MSNKLVALRIKCDNRLEIINFVSYTMGCTTAAKGKRMETKSSKLVLALVYCHLRYILEIQSRLNSCESQLARWATKWHQYLSKPPTNRPSSHPATHPSSAKLLEHIYLSVRTACVSSAPTFFALVIGGPSGGRQGPDYYL